MIFSNTISDIGEMDRRVEIWDVSHVETDYGYEDQDSLVDTVWAAYLPKTRMMREDIQAGKESSMQEIHWIIRKRTDLDKINYLKYGGLEYDIITIFDEGRGFQRLVTQLKEDAQ